MDDHRTTLDRNMEALVRRSALPLRGGDLARARGTFLREIARPVPEPRPRAGAFWAFSASLLVCAAIFSAVLADRPPAVPPDVSLPAPSRAAGGAQDSRVAPSTPEGQDRTVTLSASLPPLRDSYRNLRLDGTAALPDRAILKMSIHRLEEDSLGARLAAKSEAVSSGLVEVRSGRFGGLCPWQRPGPAVVTVEAIEDFQREEHRGKFGGRSWRFEFPAWGPELAPRLSPLLREVDSFPAEVKNLVSRFEEACRSTEAAWKASKAGLMDRAQRLRSRIESCEARRLYPAAVNHLVYTMDSLLGSAPHFAWEEGKFAGPTTYYVAAGERTKDFRGADFAFDRLRAYADEAGPMAGRELGLWIVRELRRGGPRSALSAVLLEQAAHPGFAPFAPRLETAAPEDLAALEAEIRAGAR